MNDQLFQQLLDSVTQMTEIIKKQQETIDKLTTKDVQYIQIEKVSTDAMNSGRAWGTISKGEQQ